MKKKERYKILNYAKKQYSEEFLHDYQFQHLSKNELLKLLKAHDYSSMCEWSYCCRGLYECCWQELVSEGVWDSTQEVVNNTIKWVIENTARYCKKDARILYYKTESATHIIIIARDVMYCDYLITFQNKKEYDCSIVIANNIRRYMEWKNISAEEIVEKTSFSKKDFGRVLSGNIIVAPWMLKEIAIVLGVTKKELMKGIRDNE